MNSIVVFIQFIVYALIYFIGQAIYLNFDFPYLDKYCFCIMIGVIIFGVHITLDKELTKWLEFVKQI